MKTKKKRSKSTPAGRSILRGLREIVAHKPGEPLAGKFVVHTIHVHEPGEYDANAVMKTRDKLGLSQSIFAKVVGVSASLAQSWEQGRRAPDAMARRLLDEINRDPVRWSQMIQREESAPARAGASH